MNTKHQINKWLPAVVASLALAASANLSRAASDVIQNFESGASSANDFSINFGTGSVAWNATNGVDGGAALEVTLSGAYDTNKEVAPMWTIPGGPFDSSAYMTLEYDLYVDINSATDANGSYGNLQEVFSDSTWSWDSHWVGALGTAYGGVWTHMSVPIPNNGKKYYRVIWALQGTAPYTAQGVPTNVVFYIDNVTLRAQPNPLVLDVFTNDTSTSYSGEGWTGISSTTALDTAHDAGGGFTPTGSLAIDTAFTTGWQQAWIIRNFPAFVPSRWTYIECDVMVDPSSVPDGSGNYGNFGFDVRDSSWKDNILANAPVIDSSWVGTWKHVKMPLPATTSGGPTDIMLTGTHGGALKIYVDNLMLTKPTTPPSIAQLQKGTAKGIYITVDPGTGNQWDEEGIGSPATDNPTTDFFWQNATPATYSFTLADFPAPKDAPGFLAHIYLVNGDSLTLNGQSLSYNSTYAGAPWNALDYFGFKIQNTTGNTGLIASVEWKTNMPSSNPPGTNVQSFPLSQYATANGKWTLSFTDNTHGTITGPDNAVVGNFTLPDFSSDPNSMFNFQPSSSIVQFGLSKNDTADSGVNNGKSATFTRVQATNAFIDRTDNFDTGGLQSNYVWQVCTYWKATQARAFYRPAGTGWFLEYGNPSDGFVAQVSSDLVNWASAGMTYTYTDGAGMHWGAIPATNSPAGNGYFRLIK